MWEKVGTAINLGLSALMLVAFAPLFWSEIGRVASGKTKSTDPNNHHFSYAATATDEVVASVVAAAFALLIPTVQRGQSVRGRIKFPLSLLPDPVGGAYPPADEIRKHLELAYVFAYFGIGFASLVAWLEFGASEFLKAQTSTLLGLMLPSTNNTFL